MESSQTLTLQNTLSYAIITDTDIAQHIYGIITDADIAKHIES